ncbi:hypothetical protein GN244_ATG10584 [Phytophthora infestans]|uniref:Uncharacterized protein n=1 Tax=Phytophthora infestans TaxID=4787 RepID=A0A833WU37_PHYIN|nr:hypothetical protein GN244_ATG10584 [Phytophthora infestans]KAF4135565.1 hypothetical protein GN958_ATG15259 [Phytophthora infestans]KAF4143182.1 hypothetical protein GN958_ATG07627 [Phytophthora infestans]
MYVSIVFMGVTVLTTLVSVYLSYLAARKSDELLLKEIMAKEGPQSSASLGESMVKAPKENYSINFV